MHFGQELEHIRLRRRLSKTALAKLAGLHVATIHRYERSPESLLTRSSATMLLQALSAIPTPSLTTAEAFTIADAAGLDRAAAATYIRSATPMTASDTLRADTAELVSIIGQQACSELLRSILAAIRSARPPAAAPARRYIIKQPPVQREGFIEEVETEYTEADPPPPSARKKTANGA